MSKILALLSYLQIWTPDPAKLSSPTINAGDGIAIDVSNGWIGYRYAFAANVRRHMLTISTTFRGPYSSAGVNYAANDTAVANSGRLYRCNTGHVSAAATAPESGANWATVWDPAYPYFETDQDMIGVDPTVKQIILVNANSTAVTGCREGM